MYCINCGKEVKKGTKFCSNCGTKQEEIVEKKEEIVATQPVEAKEEPNNHLANVLCTISLCLYFIGPWVFYFLAYVCGMATRANYENPLAMMFATLGTFSGLAAYVLMIIARVKCPKSTYAKVVMWIYIGLFILSIISLVVLMVTCAGILAECSGSF